jgi:hypothetical protein
VDGDVWTANLEPTTGDVIRFGSARDHQGSLGSACR